MSYRERRATVPGAVLWWRTLGSPTRSAILPDGCLDVLWDGRRLLVAGPDTAARWIVEAAGASYVALRFSGGTGPALLGVPADELRDRTVELSALLPSSEARVLAGQVTEHPGAALEAWAARRAAVVEVDPLGPRVLAMATAGTPVATMADQLGLSARQLHRRCLPLFGYGPRRLIRIVRLGQALDRARTGAPLATVAADSRYADQAHLTREVRALAGTTPARLLAAW